MATVFLSYAHEDAAKAKAIARALEDASFEVWIDDRIHSGSEFSAEIEEALRTATAVVVLWSQYSVSSAWVRDEAAEGRDTGRLIAASLDGVRPPMGFRQFQATDLSGWSRRGKPKQLDAVIAAVRAKGGASAKDFPTAVAPRFARRGRRMLLAATVLLVLAGVIAASLFLRRGTTASNTVSVALLPFTADASNSDASQLASAAHDSVAHTLSQSAFEVSTPDRISKDSGPSPDFVISGQVTRVADKFVATVRMEESAHHALVFSHQFEASPSETADLPERIGAQVASQLSWTAPMIAIERRHPSDPAVIKTLLQSSTAGMRASDELQDYENSVRLAAQAPNSPLALDQLAMNTAFALERIPRDQRTQAVAKARQAAERTIAIAPEFGGGYIPWCVLHSEQQRLECEDKLRAGMRADPDASFPNWFLSKLLNDVGRNREAAELASLSLAHDQYMPYKIGHAVRMLEVTGHSANADELFERSKRWWPKEQVLYWNRFVGFAERADFDAIDRLDREIQKETGSSSSPAPPFGPAVRARSARAVQNACAARQKVDPEPVLCMLSLASVGDLDSAYALADRLYPNRRGRTAADEERIWLDNPSPMPTVFITGPGAAPMRRDPRFLALAERIGLLEYWQRGRLPDFCQPPHPEPVCSQFR